MSNVRKEERELFFSLCRFRDPAGESIGRLLQKGADTPWVLGQLFANRMAGAAWSVLESCGLVQRVGREFRTALQNAWTQNKIKNESFYTCVERVTGALGEAACKYALLKGAFLCGWYPPGLRTAHDIDILAAGRDVTSMGEALAASGFVQGYIRGSTFVPAPRQDVISSRMLRGETVPFVARVGLPFMEFAEADINFSLDYKNDDTGGAEELLRRAETVRAGQYTVTTLHKHDFLLHLCGHLYKEAATYPWVQMKRDMTLYKFCDIYALARDYTPTDFAALEARARCLQMEEACYYALRLTKTLFAMESAGLAALLRRIAPEDGSLLRRVISPGDGKLYLYKNDDIFRRFFARDRVKMLKEQEAEVCGSCKCIPTAKKER